MISFNPFPKIKSPKIQGGFCGKNITALKKLGLSLASLVTLEQIHSDRIIEIQNISEFENAGKEQGDAIICTVPNIPIAVKTADCVPILLASPEGVIAAVHAGWRGTQQRILSKVLQRLKEDYAISIAKIKLAIGPAICGNCYEVGEEVAKFFPEAVFGPVIAVKNNGKYFLNLKLANMHLVKQAGVPSENVQLRSHCTLCQSEQYYSYRDSQKKGLVENQRNYSWIMMS